MSDCEEFLQGCISGDLVVVQRNVNDGNVNYQDHNGTTGLNWAIFQGHNRLT